MKGLAVILILISFASLGQNRQAKKDLELADAYESIREYHSALIYLERAYKRNNSVGLALRIGKAQEKLRDYESAEHWLGIAIQSDSGNLDLKTRYAKVLINTGDYTGAKRLLEQILVLKKDPEVAALAQQCELAKSRLESDNRPRIVHVPKINSAEDDFCPTYFSTGLVFTSGRQSTVIKRSAGQTGQPFYDLYHAPYDNIKFFKKPTPFGAGINSPDHEAAACFNSDYSEIYFTRCESRQGRGKDSASASQRLKLYKSSKGPLGWTKAESFMLNDSLASFGHPAYFEEAQFFIFSSNLPGGYGGADLYVSFRIDSSWTVPENLGPEVNSAGDELYPFVHTDGFLYYTSDGKQGMGGYDIYRAQLEEGDWTKVESMPYPINTHADDFSLIIDKKRKRGYFASNRPEGEGGSDIYFFTF